MSLSLSNSNYLVVDGLSLMDANKVIDVTELFLGKFEAIDNIVGLAPDTLNTPAKLGEAFNHDSNFYGSLITHLSFMANTLDTYRKQRHIQKQR